MTEPHLPWVYRPRHFDDWGWIRDSAGNIAATARGDDGSKSHDQHRSDKTDPYGEYAAFIVKAVNNHDALVKALRDTLCELTACASQLAAKGLPGHPGDSVSLAQDQARAILGVVGSKGQ